MLGLKFPLNQWWRFSFFGCNLLVLGILMYVWVFKLMFLQYYLLSYLMKLLDLLPHINQDCFLFYFMGFGLTLLTVVDFEGLYHHYKFWFLDY